MEKVPNQEILAGQFADRIKEGDLSKVISDILEKGDKQAKSILNTRVTDKYGFSQPLFFLILKDDKAKYLLSASNNKIYCIVDLVTDYINKEKDANGDSLLVSIFRKCESLEDFFLRTKNIISFSLITPDCQTDKYGKNIKSSKRFS